MTAGCPNRQPRGTLQARRQRPSPDTTLLGLYFQQPAMSDSDKGQLINDMLADMCGLIVKTIALIPPEHDDARLSACAFVLDQINEAVERMVGTDRTEH